MHRTESEKLAWRNKMASIAKKIKAMDENELQAFAGRCRVFTCEEGHVLTLRNTAMLLLQCTGTTVTPTQVGGFRQWQKIGRQVRKGEHSIGSILVPIGITKEDKGQEDDSDISFKFVPVFDVTQTEENHALCQA